MTNDTSHNFVTVFLNKYQLTLNNVKSKHSLTHKKFNSLSLPNNNNYDPKTNSKSKNFKGNIDNGQGSITDTMDKWLVNLSNTQLPAYAIDILSLGEKFNFTTHSNRGTWCLGWTV